MSYILDAIRKSDEQRLRGAAPTLLVVPAVSPRPKPRVPLSYALITSLLVAVGVVIGSLRPWQLEQRQSAPMAQAPVASLEPEPRDAARVARSSSPDAGARKEREASPQQPASIGQPARTPAAASVQKESIPASEPEIRSAPSRAVPGPSRPAPRVSSDPSSSGVGVGAGAGEQRVVAMSELPLAVQLEIPAMSISVHAYSSKPAERLVSINNQLLREGGSLAPGLVLERITPDGMIFNYRGYRFLRGVRASGETSETQ
jgi:general secretion pathway protein B